MVAMALSFALLLATPAGVATPIAGEYYQGDGTGVNWTLILKADHTFTFRWMGCLGEYGRAAGRWREERDVVKLFPSMIHDMADRLPLSYQVVRWGERVYLLTSDEIADFCSIVNERSLVTFDWTQGRFFLRAGCSNRRPAGKPSVPPTYADFLLDEPVSAKIVSVYGGRATIDAGAKDHLRPGMVMRVQTLEMTELQVISVKDHSAVVKCRRRDKMAPKGTNVSTLMVDPRFEKSFR
jgi:hypothetical protein